MNFNKIRPWHVGKAEKWGRAEKRRPDKAHCDQETFATPFPLSETINFTHKTKEGQKYILYKLFSLPL